MREHVAEMVGGPGAFRFFVQPAVAILLGVLHGLRDHRDGRPPYIAGVLAAQGNRWRLVREALGEIVIPLAVAVAASYAFQYVIQSHIHFAYGFLFAALFVALPYFLTRGLVNRLAPAPRPRQRA